MYEGPNKVYSIHQLVQHTVRTIYLDAKEIETLIKGRVFFSGYIDKDTLSVSELLASHKFLYQHIKQFYINTNSALAIDHSFSVHLMHLAQYYAADPDFSKNIHEQLPDSLLTNKTPLSSFEKARYLNTLGKIIFSSDIDKAIDMTVEAINLLQDLTNDQRSKAELFLAGVNNLADYYQIQGRISESKITCEKFKETTSALKSPLFDTVYYSFYSLCEMYAGDYKRALESINKSYESLHRGQLSESLLIFIPVNKAEILVRQGNLIEADKFLRHLNKLIEETFLGKDNHLTIRTEIINSLFLVKTGKSVKAKEMVQSCLRKYEKLIGSEAGDPLQGFAHTTLAEIHILESDYKRAIAELEMAEKIFDAVVVAKEIDDLSTVYQHMTITAARMKNVELARTYLRKQVKEFGLKHPRTIEIVRYFDLNQLPVPW